MRSNKHHFPISIFFFFFSFLARGFGNFSAKWQFNYIMLLKIIRCCWRDSRFYKWQNFMFKFFLLWIIWAWIIKELLSLCVGWVGITSFCVSIGKSIGKLFWNENGWNKIMKFYKLYKFHHKIKLSRKARKSLQFATL